MLMGAGSQHQADVSPGDSPAFFTLAYPAASVEAEPVVFVSPREMR